MKNELEITPIIKPDLTGEAHFLRDKTKSDFYMFWFDLFWYFITFSVSWYNMKAPATNPYGLVYILMVFALPIIIKHVLYIPLFSTISEYKQKFFKGVCFIVNMMFLTVSGFIIFIFLTINTPINDVRTLKLIVPTLHYLILFIGIYDKIVSKMKPNSIKEAN